MKRSIFSALVYLFILFFTGCDRQADRHEAFKKWIQNNGKIKVLSTTAMIDDLVRKIGGDYIDSIILIQGELDPHSYQLVKGDDEKLTFADVIFYNGLGLEHGPSLHVHLVQNNKAVGIGDLIETSDPDLIIEVNGQKDPHIWTDISLWVKAIPFIIRALGEKDPAHAKEFAENGNRLERELLEVHRRVLEIMQEVPQEHRYLVTSHDAFNYFTRAYLSEKSEVATGEWRKRFAAPEGLAPESQLSTADIRAIIDYMKEHRIRLLFPESNVSRDSIKKILRAGEAQGLQLEIVCCPLYGDAMGPAGSAGDSYAKMIEYNAKTIAKHMTSEERHVGVDVETRAGKDL